MPHSITIARAFGASTISRVLQWDGVAYVPQPIAGDTSAPRVFRGWANPSKEGHALVVGDQWKRLSDSAPTRNFILDTDASGDVDDLFDIKAALVLQAERMHNLLGVAVTTSNPYSPAVVGAMADHYGVSRPSIASLAPLTSFDPGRPFTDIYETIYNTFPHTGLGLASTFQSSTTGYRTWLASAADASVEVLTTGFAKGLVLAMQSGADGISSLTGLQLFASKVSRIYVCAGVLPTGTDAFNVGSNLTDWDWLMNNCPVPITWIGVNVGDTTSVAKTYISTRLGTSDICWAGMNAFGGTGRPLWGVIAAQYVLEGKERLGFTEYNGTMAINVGTGLNTFTVGAGTQRYADSTRYAAMNSVCGSLVAADLVTGDKTWNGSAWV